MSYSKEKRDKHKKSGEISITSKVKSGWQQKRPVLIFVGLFALLMALFYTMWLSDFFNQKIHPHIISTNAAIAGNFLKPFQQNVRTDHEMIYSSKFSISVARGCDGIEAMALFASALLAFPLTWKRKIKGLLIGLFLLFSLNIIRIISLYLIGVYAHSFFEIMHVEVWQVLFIFCSLGLLIYWIRPEKKGKSHA